LCATLISAYLWRPVAIGLSRGFVTNRSRKSHTPIRRFR